MDFNESLYAALKDTEYLLDENKQNHYPSISESFQYNMSYREVLIYTKLGEYLSNGKKLNVLDVGSGKLLTATKLIKGTSFVATYTAIDNQVDANDHATNVKPYVASFEYHKLDILTDDFATDKTYDIVMIDVEPHGKEIEVYERVKHALAESHLCILKHVGCLDMYGSCLADRFLAKYEDHMSDYYGESSRTILSILCQVRDVFILFDKTKTTNIRALLTCDPVFKYADESIKMFCRCTRVPKLILKK